MSKLFEDKGWAKLVVILTFLMLGAVFFLGFFLPIMSDEIDWSIKDRIFHDNFELVNLRPFCKPIDQVAAPIPFLWYPSAFINHVFLMLPEGLIWVRAVGSIRCLLFLICCVTIIRLLKPVSVGGFNWLVLAFLFVFMLDSLPLLMQVKRPEQGLILPTVFIMALALSAKHFAIGYKKYVAGAALIISILLLFPAHPKSIILLPLIAFLTHAYFKRAGFNRISQLSIIIFLLVFAIQSTAFWFYTINCSELPKFQEGLTAKYSLPFDILLENPIEFLKSLFLVFSLSFLVQFFVFHLPNWIPFSVSGIPYLEFIALVPFTIAVLVKLALFLLCLTCSAKTAGKTIINLFYIKKYQRKDVEKPDFLSWLALLLFISMLGTMVIVGKEQMYYFPAILMPLLYLSAICSIAASRNELRNSSRYRLLFSIIFIASVCNMALLGLRYYPYITDPLSRNKVWEFPEYQRTIVQSQFEYDDTKTQVLQAYDACGLPDPQTAKHLLLDTFTYPVLKNTYQPYFFLYMNNGYSGDPIPFQKFSGFMQKYKSDGVLVHCEKIHNEQMHYYKKFGNYCCMKATDIPAN